MFSGKCVQKILFVSFYLLKQATIDLKKHIIFKHGKKCLCNTENKKLQHVCMHMRVER